MKKKVDTTKLLAVFATTTLIFIIGLFIGSEISKAKLNDIQNVEEALRVDTLSIELQYTLLSEDPCLVLNSSTLSDELYEVGGKLDFMENNLGPKNQRVTSLKEYYSLLELRHWIFLKKAQKECNANNALILYFYSNLGDCSTCKEQGFVLDYLRKKSPGIQIYSFDINLDNPVLKSIKELYHVQDAPSLIIDDELYIGFKDRDEIETLI